jgi:hypothetical protein
LAGIRGDGAATFSADATGKSRDRCIYLVLSRRAIITGLSPYLSGTGGRAVVVLAAFILAGGDVGENKALAKATGATSHPEALH